MSPVDLRIGQKYSRATMDTATYQAQNLYYQSAYISCIENGRAAPAGEAGSTRRLYAARSAAALGDWATTRSFVGDGVEFQAVALLADALEGLESGNEIDELLAQFSALISDAPDSVTVRYCAALAAFSAGDAEGALTTLNVDGSGSCKELECVALGVHIFLAINRIDLADKEFLAARQWGDDALLVQLMEAWIALARGGRATQQAYYVYDEMSQSTNIASTPGVIPTLVGKAVASAALGEAAQGRDVLTAADRLGGDAQVSANIAVLSALEPAGNADSECVSTNRSVATVHHPIAADWAAKRAELSDAISSFA